MSESDAAFRKEVEEIISGIETFCKITMRTIQVSPEQQLRKDIIYLCDKLIPEMNNMVKVLSMKNSELTITNDLLIKLCENYKEAVELQEDKVE